MKILRLDIKAFGPFTDRILELSSGNEGLHIIYGPNEAGKSSALRALRQMLFGIPARSPDNFIHPYTKMRIGGTLRKKDGTELSFIRRKGRGNTLRDSEDTAPLDEAALLPFLGGADENLFTVMFGIDHPGLVQGGEEIIRGGGNIGQVLFAAGSGISGFRAVLDDLQTEADSLFKPSAQKPRINEAINEFRQTQNAIREVQLSAQEWDRHFRARVKAEKEKAECEKNLEEKMREKNRLERIAEALPVIARRSELLSAYEPLSHVLLLPPDFADRRRKAFEELRLTESAEKQAGEHLEELRAALELLHVPEGLLAQAASIHALNQETGNIRKIIRERYQLELKQNALLSDAREILRNLRGDISLEQAEELRPEKKDVIRIRELGTLYERLNTRKEHLREEMEKLQLHVEGLQLQNKEDKDAGEKEGSTAELREMIEEVRKHGDAEGRYQALCDEIRRNEKEVDTALEKLPLWRGSPEGLETMRLPVPESLDIFENRFRAVEDKVRQLQKDRETCEQRVAEIESGVQELRLGGEVPTEQDLLDSRENRDQKWRSIRHVLENEKTDTVPPPEQMDNYESSILQADDMGDRLRREADRAARKAGLLAEREKEQARLKVLVQKNEEAKEELAIFGEEWQAIWKESRISPLTPREMRSWMQKQGSLAAQIRDLRGQKDAAAQLRILVENCMGKLKKSLEKIGETPEETEGLSHLIRQAVRTADRLDKSRTQKERLLAEIREKESGLAEARMRLDKTREELEQWRGDWAGAVRFPGLDADVSPAQANAVMEDLQSLFGKIREAGMLAQRIRTIDRDTESFADSVAPLLSREAPDLKHLPPEQAVSELSGRLNRALEIRTEQEGLKKQIRQEQSRLQKAGDEKARISTLLRTMCETAGCEDHRQLPLAEEASEKRRQTETQLAETDTQLRKLGAGAVPEDFIREAQGMDPDSILPRVRQLAEEIGNLEKEKSGLDQTIGMEKNELARMDGDAKAAELAEQGQSILAGIERDAEHYVRVRLASRILSHAIERYREKNQGPILRRSGELFSRMTLGSFAGLRTEFTDKNEAVLAGLRPDGQAVYVEGMSEGTADQLYLALRLASLEAWMEKNEALPFIADDILIQFDDGRVAATLEVLAGLSAQTQVIFFTHHRHLLELAEKRLDGEKLFVHELQGGGN